MEPYQLLPLLLLLNSLMICAYAEKPSDPLQATKSRRVHNFNPAVDLVPASSVALKNYKIQSVAPRSSGSTTNRRYGYPYLIAPTLTPGINARSDDDNDDTFHVAKPKPLGSKIGVATDSRKKSNQKKFKGSYTLPTRRQGYVHEDESSVERRHGAYQEPKYRNFDELESSFRPRRIDISAPYPDYSYSLKKRPLVSPRDPYLSPSNEPTDTFYPTVPKAKSYSPSYGPSTGQDIPSYGAGSYEDSHPYHDDHHHHDDDYTKSSYGGSNKYPSSSQSYDYQEDYEVESNKPIVGDIRKRLLDYAGASNLYKGEPDYFEEIARNKHKYGHVANDYYAYGGPAYKSSYRDFPYVESKVRVVKKAPL